jgi:hypothetical protein
MPAQNSPARSTKTTAENAFSMVNQGGTDK